MPKVLVTSRKGPPSKVNDHVCLPQNNTSAFGEVIKAVTAEEKVSSLACEKCFLKWKTEHVWNKGGFQQVFWWSNFGKSNWFFWFLIWRTWRFHLIIFCRTSWLIYLSLKSLKTTVLVYLIIKKMALIDIWKFFDT